MTLLLSPSPAQLFFSLRIIKKGPNNPTNRIIRALLFMSHYYYLLCIIFRVAEAFSVASV